MVYGVPSEEAVSQFESLPRIQGTMESHVIQLLDVKEAPTMKKSLKPKSYHAGRTSSLQVDRELMTIKERLNLIRLPGLDPIKLRLRISFQFIAPLIPTFPPSPRK